MDRQSARVRWACTFALGVLLLVGRATDAAAQARGWVRLDLGGGRYARRYLPTSVAARIDARRTDAGTSGSDAGASDVGARDVGSVDAPSSDSAVGSDAGTRPRPSIVARVPTARGVGSAGSCSPRLAHRAGPSCGAQASSWRAAPEMRRALALCPSRRSWWILALELEQLRHANAEARWQVPPS